MKNTPIVVEATINAKPDAVWRAFTNKDRMREWQFDIKEFKPVVGFEFSFLGGPPEKKYLHVCKVTEAAPSKLLSYSWRYDGYEGNSQVTFELFPAGERTRLKVTHTGVDTFPTTNSDFAKTNFVTGWTEIVGDLKKKLEQK